MTRTGLAVLLWLSTLPTWAGPQAPLVRVPRPPPRDERVVSLGPAEVRELAGEVTAQAGAAPAAPRALTPGMTLGHGARVRTSPRSDSRVELRFADGSLLRLDTGSEVSILAEQRQVILHRGRVLVSADRMVGGIAVVTAQRAFLPEGTTYVVEVSSAVDGRATTSHSAASLRLRVLEGAVCACAVEGVADRAATGTPRLRTAPKPAKEQIVLPGEAWTAARAASGQAETHRTLPIAMDLASTVRSEPLLVAFSTPLPTLAKINELADQQRRRLLTGRNARLRREIFWKRPPRAPLKLPALLAAPDSVSVTYE